MSWELKVTNVFWQEALKHFLHLVWWSPKISSFPTTCKASCVSGGFRGTSKSTSYQGAFSASGVEMTFPSLGFNINPQSKPPFWREIWFTAAPLPPPPHTIPVGSFSPKSISAPARQQLIFQSCYFEDCLRVLLSSQTDSLLLATCWLDRRDKYLASQAQNTTRIMLLASKGWKKK